MAQKLKPDLGSLDKAVMMPFQKRKQLERDLEHITEEMYRRNKELAETNKTLSLLRAIDSLVLDSHESLHAVSDSVAQLIAETADYPFVGIFTKTSRLNGDLLLRGTSIQMQGSSHLELDKPLYIRGDSGWLSSLEMGKLVDLEGHQAADISLHLNYSTAEIRSLKRSLPLQSLYAVKLLSRKRLVGVIVVGYMQSAAQLSGSQVLLVDRLSESLGVALDNKLLSEENQRVLRRLQETNEKLKALDETKDDFISMASHQLRTPLTSVKGYISMVLEEDAGKLNKVQREMLSQAAISSQRMVYLIADLLNVSRLKTGKFIIDSMPVNLADVVEQELAQLKETAASRQLKLVYNKPKDFPSLMLDETKTRQVIMNFADNAIYYTPAGGTINVELKETNNTVELRIKDDGIGVPKSEQPHLFTKFYRAGNARKARPDGTGLGLFMAKKVIVSQGGALIFESKEGKGSTFGFMFNKQKLAPAQAGGNA